MINIRIRCKLCNEYVSYNVSDSAYFKWIQSGKVDDLKLSIDDQILFLTKTCNKCRLNKEVK